MNYSEPFKQTNKLCKFSPNGKFIANASQYRLVIRDAKTLQIVKLHKCLDVIDLLEWSPDSEFISCAMISRCLTQVWSVNESDWTCKIDEGSAGLLEVKWSNDSRHILTTAEFHLRITVWSLITKSVSYIKYPKNCKKAISFCNNENYMALAERRECEDFVGIFNTDNWQLLKHFEVATKDLDGILWSPDDKFLLIWEVSMKYNILLYSPAGILLVQYSAYEFALGIKSVCWSTSSQFIAVGSYDEKVRILNYITLSSMFEHEHTATLDARLYNHVTVYKETEEDLVGDQKSYSDSKVIADLLKEVKIASSKDKFKPSKYNVLTDIRDLVVPSTTPNVEKSDPKVGVGQLQFSADSLYLYTINDNMPTTVWIYEIKSLSLKAILVHLAPVKSIQWDKNTSRLAMCTGSNKIYIWCSEKGCMTSQVSISKNTNFIVQNLSWSPDGRSLLLASDDHMVVSFLTDELLNSSRDLQQVSEQCNNKENLPNLEHLKIIDDLV